VKYGELFFAHSAKKIFSFPATFLLKVVSEKDLPISGGTVDP